LYIVVGTLAPAILALGLDEDSKTNNYMLYLMFGLPPIFTSVLRTLMFFTVFKYETPMFYVMKGFNKKARKVLGEVYLESQISE
jgi:hypothetical protein